MVYSGTVEQLIIYSCLTSVCIGSIVGIFDISYEKISFTIVIILIATSIISYLLMKSIQENEINRYLSLSWIPWFVAICFLFTPMILFGYLIGMIMFYIGKFLIFGIPIYYKWIKK